MFESTCRLSCVALGPSIRRSVSHLQLTEGVQCSLAIRVAISPKGWFLHCRSDRRKQQGLYKLMLRTIARRVATLTAVVTLVAGFVPILVLSLATDSFWPRSRV